MVRPDRVTGRDRIDFHSFRRKFVETLDHAGVRENEVAQVAGHERKGITFSVYNREGLRLPALREVVEKVSYEGLP